VQNGQHTTPVELLESAEKWYSQNNTKKAEVILFSKRKTKEIFEVEITEQKTRKIPKPKKFW